jgi:hypothetical protein
MPCGLSHAYVPRKGVHAAACPFKTSPLRPQDGGGRVSPGSGVYTAHALASSVGPQDKILASGPSHISRASRDVTFPCAPRAHARLGAEHGPTGHDPDALSGL